MAENSYLSDLFKLEGKVVLVTGATGQIGYEICSAFEKAGSYIIGTDKLLTINKQLMSDNCEYLELDIMDKPAVVELIDKVFEKHGRLDVLINNAGVSCFEPFEERPVESIDWVMDVNLKGTLFCIQVLFNKLKKEGCKANIVNIASHYGIISPDFRIYTDCDRKNSEIYGATKAGIIQMTRYFAVHLAEYGIRVNCISPGGIFNPQSPQGSDFIKNYSFRCPMGRMANADEMVGGILYLATDASSYTSGHNLIIDGGMSCW